jgi:hypothetical protein
MPEDDRPLEITPEEWKKLKDQSGGLLHDPKQPEQEVDTNVEPPSLDQKPLDPKTTYEGDAADGRSGLFGKRPWLDKDPDWIDGQYLTGQGIVYQQEKVLKIKKRLADEDAAAAAKAALGEEVTPAPLDPDLDTGHYDDGHAFGWKTKDTQAAEPTKTYEGQASHDGDTGLFGEPDADPEEYPQYAPKEREPDLFDPSTLPKDASSDQLDPNIDTGHYDDGHAFGWAKQAEPTPPSRTVDILTPLVVPASSALPIPLIGGVVGLVLLAGVAFAVTRGGPQATATAAPAAIESVAASAPTQGAASRSCAAAPDLALKLSGALTADVKQGCPPVGRVQNRPADDPAPACRDIVPGVGGALVAAVDVVSFVVNGVQYDMTMSAFKELPRGEADPTLPSSFRVVAGSSDPPVWATVSVRGGAGSTAKLWRRGTGTLTLASDHRSGTIDAELPDDAGGPTLRISGSWQVLGQCRAG